MSSVGRRGEKRRGEETATSKTKGATSEWMEEETKEGERDRERERRNLFNLGLGGNRRTNERTGRDKRKVNFNGGETRFAFGGKRRRKKRKKRFRCGEGEGKTFVKMDVGRVSFIESPRTREIEREKESPSYAPLEWKVKTLKRWEQEKSTNYC